MKFFDKKGDLTWQQIALAIVAIVVVILVILWFRSGGEKGFGFVGQKIGELKDCDGDKVADMFDKCPCKEGSVDNEGCLSKTPSDADKGCTDDQKKNCAQCGQLTSCPPPDTKK